MDMLQDLKYTPQPEINSWKPYSTLKKLRVDTDFSPTSLNEAVVPSLTPPLRRRPSSDNAYLESLDMYDDKETDRWSSDVAEENTFSFGSVMDTALLDSSLSE